MAKLKKLATTRNLVALVVVLLNAVAVLTGNEALRQAVEPLAKLLLA